VVGVNPLLGGANNPLSVVGVAAFNTLRSAFGSIGGYTLANTYNAAGGLLQSAQNQPYGAILDMQDQVLGFAGQPQDNLTITVGRGTAAGAFDANGPNLLIEVTDTTLGPGGAPNPGAQYNGVYFDQPIMNGATPLITSLVVRGNNGSDKFIIDGNLQRRVGSGGDHRTDSCGPERRANH
jgi:hypothetical protein